MKQHSHQTKHQYGSLKPYVIGFVLSLVLTLAAYFLTVSQSFGTSLLVTVLIVLAVTQLIVQLVFFLHLAQEQAPRWQLWFFMSTVGIVLLVVVGSIWIMTHLNYNMRPEQMQEFLIKDEGIQK